MQNLLDKTVEVKTNDGVVTGKLYDYTADGETVWVETEEDIFVVKHVVSVTEAVETEEEHPLFSVLDAMGVDYSVVGDDEEGFDILINGFTYMVNVQECEDIYYCYTTHKRRYEKERHELYGETNNADGNARKIKKLETVLRYVAKWVDA
jgi:glycerol-3-phosphate cytidylyltransferase-like family protein